MWGEKSVVVVTGASRGIGREIALRFAERVGDGSRLVLIARDAAALQDTRRAVAASPKTAKVSVSVLAMDLSRTEGVDFNSALESAFLSAAAAADDDDDDDGDGDGDGCCDPSDFSRAVLVHNAGTLGTIDKKLACLGDGQALELWKAYYDLHVFSVIALNTAFFGLFASPTVKKTVVNVTSLAAVVAIPGWSMYCSARAAREGIFRSLAAEEPGTAVLSYSPGPVDTDMLSQVREESLPETKKMMENAVVLTAQQTTSRLVDVLEKGSFKSGGRVDYFDFDTTICG